MLQRSESDEAISGGPSGGHTGPSDAIAPENTSELDPGSRTFFQQFDRRETVQEINLRLLSPYQRALLVLDGTVTKFIEAVSMDRVEIVCIGQRLRTLPADHAALVAPAGSRVLTRSVILEGRYSHRFHAHAISLIAVDRLPDALRQALELEGEGIGRILGANEMETRREVLWSGRECIAGLPAEVRLRWVGEFILRTYRIHSNGEPIMLISERFPFPKTEFLDYD